MIRTMCLAAGLVAFSTAGLADDVADCSAGVAMIKAELDKKPAEALRAKLEKALTDAEREAKEKEYDECLEAVEDAKEMIEK